MLAAFLFVAFGVSMPASDHRVCVYWKRGGLCHNGFQCELLHGTAEQRNLVRRQKQRWRTWRRSQDSSSTKEVELFDDMEAMKFVVRAAHVQALSNLAKFEATRELDHERWKEVFRTAENLKVRSQFKRTNSF